MFPQPAARGIAIKYIPVQPGQIIHVAIGKGGSGGATRSSYTCCGYGPWPAALSGGQGPDGGVIVYW